ncbi:MAG: hypothetical protein R6U50_08890 [Desulfobacterales bacterium]
MHDMNRKGRINKGTIKKHLSVKETPKPEEPPREAPHLVHTSRKRMRCVFNSLVIRNDSIKAKYQGGLRRFHQTHGGMTNNDISVFVSMDDEVDGVVMDLIDNGLSNGQDFTFVDAGGFSIYASMSNEDYPQDVQLQVDWLKGRYAEGGIWVWLVEGDNYLE